MPSASGEGVPDERLDAVAAVNVERHRAERGRHGKVEGEKRTADPLERDEFGEPDEQSGSGLPGERVAVGGLASGEAEGLELGEQLAFAEALLRCQSAEVAGDRDRRKAHGVPSLYADGSPPAGARS